MATLGFDLHQRGRMLDSARIVSRCLASASTDVHDDDVLPAASVLHHARGHETQVGFRPVNKAHSQRGCSSRYTLDVDGVTHTSALLPCSAAAVAPKNPRDRVLEIELREFRLTARSRY
jgi:hypothetical protein